MTNAHSTAKTTKTKATDKTLRETSQRHYTVGYISSRHETKAKEAHIHYSTPLHSILKTIGWNKPALQPGNR